MGKYVEEQYVRNTQNISLATNDKHVYPFALTIENKWAGNWKYREGLMPMQLEKSQLAYAEISTCKEAQGLSAYISKALPSVPR